MRNNLRKPIWLIIIIIIIIIIIALQNAQRGKKIEMGLAVISSDEASADWRTARSNWQPGHKLINWHEVAMLWQ